MVETSRFLYGRGAGGGVGVRFLGLGAGFCCAEDEVQQEIPVFRQEPSD